MAAHVKVTYEDTGHPGWDAIRFVHRLLMIDEPWTQWHDDGFTWWAHELAQRYRWEGPIDIDDLPTWFLSVETDFLCGVTDRSQALAFVNRWNASLEFGVGALVVENDRVRLRSRTYAMPESMEDRARLLSGWGIIANGVASQLGRVHGSNPSELVSLGVDPSWAVDASGHPDAGGRETPDEMLGVIGALYVPQGQEPASEAVDVGLDEAVHSLMGAGVEAVGGEFGGALLARWRAPYGQLTWRLERAHQHPTLGFGARSRLFVRLNQDGLVPSAQVAPLVELAHALNELEGATVQPLIGGGAWATAEDEEPRVLVYTAFFPNAGLRGRLAQVLATNTWLRGQWLDRVLQEAAAMAGSR